MKNYNNTKALKTEKKQERIAKAMKIIENVCEISAIINQEYKDITQAEKYISGVINEKDNKEELLWILDGAFGDDIDDIKKKEKLVFLNNVTKAVITAINDTIATTAP